MATPTQGTSWTTSLRVPASTTGQMGAITSVTGGPTRWKASAPSPGQMAVATSVSTTPTRNTGMGPFSGLTSASTRESGRKAGRMERGTTPSALDKIGEKAFGSSESVSTGLIDFDGLVSVYKIYNQKKLTLKTSISVTLNSKAPARHSLAYALSYLIPSGRS